ncbi:hypothetical protein CH372_18480 [Leptospira meyeri]|uniref:LA_2444/LA_4059 family outer membrane protein n=1 Tax=Leptospira meyeri TaxID=29508 RepID=UPI000C2A8466|nr:LA_2444/LA_4059 family outer membrane protein [Leptospira meyeri]PKA10611.1 hypothetical protein CH372_18480 [Leptospira meyeri]PKA23494.1 hypothetical protein CH381_25265 [Leptospira sp. mixed culture ATI2-C-A1]
MNKKKKLIIVTLLLLNLNLHAEEEIPQKNERKGNHIYLRRNKGYAAPNEFNMYNSIFPISFAYDTPSLYYNTFGFVKFLGESKFSIEGNFYELKKTNIAFNYLSPYSERFSKGNLGTYYKSEQNLLLNYHLIENRIIFNIGLQRIQSDLSDSRFGYYNYNFSQNANGISAGFLLESPRFKGFYISAGYRYSILNGISGIQYSIVTSGRNVQTFDVKDNPYTKYFINETKLILGFELNDSIILSIGFIGQYAKIEMNKSQILTKDQYSDFLIRSYIESFANAEIFETSFASITYKY